MDQTSDSITISQSTKIPIKSSKHKNPFLGCFGFSGKIVEKKKQKVNSDDKKKDTLRFPWSRLRRKKVELYEKVSLCTRVHADLKSQLTVTGDVKALEGQGRRRQDKPRKGKHKPAKDEIIEHSESLDGRKSPKTGTCEVCLCPDKKQEAKKDKVNLPQSLELGSELIQKSSSQSKASSLTLQKRKKRTRVEKKSMGTNERKLEGNSESLYGLSIIMVTLLIMLVWGKLCAILCTSAWLYFISRFKRVRSDAGENSVGNGSTLVNSNMNYEKDKKKVVLDGFLERNHKSTLRILPNTNKDVG